MNRDLDSDALGVRPQLFAIAYRMVGAASDAEEIVQEAYFRLQRALSDGTTVDSAPAYLTTITTRLAIDHLRSARVTREHYTGTWLPEPILTEPDISEHVEMADSLSLSFLILLETLSPIERAVFLLREVFDYPYNDIAQIVDKNEANCRQVFLRARRHLNEGKPRYEATRPHHDLLTTTFQRAAQNGTVDDLIDILAADVAFYSDGGGKARAIAAPVFGRTRVTRLLAGFFQLYRSVGAQFSPAHVNGGNGLLAFDAHHQLINVFALDTTDNTINTIRSILNPDKLTHLGYPISNIARTDTH